MALRDYLTDEIVHDAVDGRLTRREALRRLGLLGISLSGAAALLAACGDDGDSTTNAAATSAGSTPPTAAATTAASATSVASSEASADTTAETAAASAAPSAAELITFDGPAGPLQGAFAAAADPKGAVLVIHENRGLTPHFFDVVSRLASAGYTALAVDLASRAGGTAALADEGAVQAALGQASQDDLIADLRAGIDELEQRAPGEKIGAVGFCFGGGMVWNLLGAGEPRLAAAAPFYGPASGNLDFSGSPNAAVLAVYGELDDRVNSTRDAATAALEAAGLPHEVKTYSGANHAFFNDTGQRYNESAATEAYADLLAWYDQYLAS